MFRKVNSSKIVNKCSEKFFFNVHEIKSVTISFWINELHENLYHVPDYFPFSIVVSQVI